MRHRALRWRNISGQLQAGKMQRANWLPLILPLSSVLASFTALLLLPFPSPLGEEYIGFLVYS